MRTAYTADVVLDRLSELDGWSAAPDRASIRREFVFADFPRAFAFMAAVATRAEKMDHHPDWRNVYNRVEVTLSSHDVGGVTERDLALATYLDSLYPSFAGTARQPS